MAPSLITGSNRIICIAMLAVFLMAGLSACQQVPKEQAVQGPITVEMNGVYFESPKGVKLPQGLEELTGEMIPNEVEKIMGARYPRPPDSILDQDPIIMEAFTYIEDGVTKYIDIWYVSGKLDFVRYGNERSRGME